MTHAETTRSRTHRSRSATELLYWLRVAVWVVFCVLLLVLR
jgi:hypothetical protein